MAVVISSTDQISLAAFIVEARRRVPRGTLQVSETELRDPLAAILTRIQSSPNTMEHRVLVRLLQCIVDDPAEDMFRKTEISAFGPAVLVLVSAFIDDFEAGRYTRAAIRSALAIQEISTPQGK